MLRQGDEKMYNVLGRKFVGETIVGSMTKFLHAHDRKFPRVFDVSTPYEERLNCGGKKEKSTKICYFRPSYRVLPFLCSNASKHRGLWKRLSETRL